VLRKGASQIEDGIGLRNNILVELCGTDFVVDGASYLMGGLSDMT
jgi:hypothetical protein